MISSLENLPESIYQPDSGFDWERLTLSLQDGFVRAAFCRVVGKTSLVQVISSEPLPGTGPVAASTELVRAAPLRGIDGSLSLG